MDPEKEAKTFAENYYKTFDSDPAALANMYQEGSMLTFEGQKIQGSQDIIAKLTSLPYEQCKHTITTVDCQPCGPAGGMLVFVNGDLQLAGQQHAVKFSQVDPAQTSNVTITALFRVPSLTLLRDEILHGMGGRVFRSTTYLCETQRGAITDLEPAAKEFVGIYYFVCDRNPPQLLNVYQEGSMSSFVGEKIQGSQNIVTKLKNDLRSYRHVISNVECQPSGPAWGVFAMVKGELQRTDGPDAFKFSQIFHLIPTPQGSFYVLNDIFRLI